VQDSDMAQTATATKRINDLRRVPLDCQRSKGVLSASNENKMSDGWRESAWLRVEGGISWKVRNQSCQPFAPSLGWTLGAHDVMTTSVS
jgi:hypothetical protein